VFSSDLLGFDPATLNVMILCYRLMTKWSGLGDSMELSRMGLSQKLCKIEIGLTSTNQKIVMDSTKEATHVVVVMTQLWQNK
jgi:hypothetical protein